MLKRSFCGAIVAALILTFSMSAEEKKAYELRTYTAHQGKEADLHARFRNHTMRIFEKHGMKNVGYWVPKDQPGVLMYILEHKDEAAAKKSWDAFRSDPEWLKAKGDSEKNGPIVEKVTSVFYSATDYSPIK